MTTQTTPPPIKKIIVHNIQSLPHAEIEPAPPGQMTVIIGESDSGKTALASRALRKLFFNDIPTKDIVRRKCKSASISVVYDTPDNLTVSWRWKGRTTDTGKAWWEIARDGAEPIILEGGGRQGNVPEAIQDITGVRPVTIGSTTLNFNFNRQLDGPFLGSASPAERYRILGILAGTLEVDAAVKEVGTEIIRARRREMELSREIAELERRIKEYSWLEDLGRDIKKIEAALAEVGRKQELMDKLAELREEIVAQEEIAGDAGDIVLALGRIINHAGDLLTGIEAKIATHQKLAATRSNITAHKEILTRTKNILTITSGIAEGQEILSKIERNYNLAGRLGRLHRDIQGEETRLSSAQNILTATRTHQEAAEALERISKVNHTRGLLMSCYAGITKAGAEILRASEILSLTAWVDQGKETLSRVEAGIPKVKKLRELAGEISSRIWDLDQAEAVLAATEGVGRGNEVLKKVEDGAAKLNRLTHCQEHIIVASLNMYNYSGQAKEFVAKIEIASQEYRELLLEAGICENCPVVGEVLAAVE